MYLFTLAASILDRNGILYRAVCFVVFRYRRDHSMSYALACRYFILDHFLEDRPILFLSDFNRVWQVVDGQQLGICWFPCLQ